MEEQENLNTSEQQQQEQQQQQEEEKETTESTPVSAEALEYRALCDRYKGNFIKALFEYCFTHNIFFDSRLMKKILDTFTPERTLELMPKIYTDSIEADFRYKGLTFFNQIHMENFEKIYSEELNLLLLSEDDRKNRQGIIEIFSYDPFQEEAPEDKPQLYRDLIGLTSEGLRKDVAKQKAAISIVKGYANIERYQKKVTELTNSGKADEETQKQLDQYMKVIATIQSNLNQTATTNNFVVRGIGSNGKGMLSDVMNQIESQGIDEGMTNFYDIATSKSIREVANISWKAQLNQLSFSNTDYADILATQAEIVREAQDKARMAAEALRLAKEKITKQELLEELALDYRKKNISEEEIIEFISREYNLKDGTQ